MTHWKEGDQDRRQFNRASEHDAQQQRNVIALAATEAARVISAAAEIALKTVAQAATLANAGVSVDITNIKDNITEIKTLLSDKYVTKESFNPVKLISYGLVTLICVSVVGALLTVVLKGKPV